MTPRICRQGEQSSLLQTWSDCIWLKIVKITFERSTVYPLTSYGSVLNRQHQVFKTRRYVSTWNMAPRICWQGEQSSLLQTWLDGNRLNSSKIVLRKQQSIHWPDLVVYLTGRTKHSRLEVMYLHEIWLTDYIETISNHLCYILDQTAIG
jgi:hypothetical protein